MTEGVQVPRPIRFLGAVRAAAGIAAALGLTVLAAWMIGRPALAALGSEAVPVAPSTGFLFVLFAGSILLSTRSSPRPGAAAALAGSGGAVALALLVLGVLGIHPDLEHPGISILDTPGSPPLGHMSTVTAGSFLLIAGSLLAATRGRRPAVVGVARGGAALVLGVGLVLGLGYLYGTPFLYSGAFIPPAFLTSAGVVALGAALLGLAGLPGHPAAGIRTPHAGLLGGIFAVLAAGIVGTGFLLQRSFEARYRAGVEHELVAVAELKTRELEIWRAEREADAAIFVDNPAFQALARRVVANPADAAARAAVRDWFVRVWRSQLYSRVSLLDATAAERIAVPDTRGSLEHRHRPAVEEALREGSIGWIDLHRGGADEAVHLDVIAPLGSGPLGPEGLGAVALRIDAETALFPILAEWPTDSRTAELTLARREGNDVLILTPLRFAEGAALSLRIPVARTERPVVQAALGREGVVYGRSYRGEPVVAAARAIPGSPWVLVVRVDVAEAFAAARARLWVTLLLVGLLVSGAGAGVRSVWQDQRLRAVAREGDRERQLGVLADNFPGLVSRVDRNLRYRFASRGYERVFGIPPSDVVGRTVAEVIGAESFEAARPHLEQGLSGKRVSYDALVTRGSGAPFHALMTVVPDVAADGTTAGLFIVALDTTERHQVQAALRASEDRFRSTLDSMREGFQIIGHDWRYVYLNDAAAAHGHRTKEELLGRTMMEMYAGIEHTPLFDVLRRCMEDRTFRRIEHEFTYPDGATAWFDLSIAAVPDGISVISLDVTERHRAEAALRVNEERLRLALAASSQGLYDLNVQTGATVVSPEYARMLGYEPHELEETNARWLARLHPDDRAPVGQAYADYIAGLRPDYRVEFRQRTKDGRWVWVLSLGKLVAWDAEGRPLRMLGTHTDITARKLAEGELRESRERIRRLAFVQEEAREAERKRVAGELHDELGGALTGIKMDLRWLTDRIRPDTDDVRARAAQALTLVDTTVDAVRRISAELRPGVLDDLGLAAAIQWQAKDLQRRSGLAVRLTGLEAVPPLEAGPALAVFRILQEALTNVARHARATQIEVSVATADGRLRLEIRDDGCGPRTSASRERPGLGILGMQERAAAWGGTVVIGGASPGGTVVTLDMPVDRP
jgi:two-component system sensor histidine kinase UhpB